MTVWITRTEPGASATAGRVRALGLEALVQPLLEVRSLANAVIDLDDVCAVAFTSPNAVRAFAERSTVRDLRVFAVGDATAAAAKAAGFRQVLSASGDVKALAAALSTRRRELAGVILNPAAAEPAADLAGALAAVGLRVRTTTVYETVAAMPPPAFLDGLAQIDHVLLHSAKAARALAEVLEAHPAPRLTALAISRAAASPLARSGLADVRFAPIPDEAALLALLEG